MPGAKKKAPRAPKSAPGLELVPISSLREAPWNPRVMDPEELAKLGESLSAFGWLDPVVANRNGRTVVGGHQRLLAAKDLGWDEALVLWVDLTPEQEKAANLALNRISGRWDFERLSQVLQDLGASPLVTATGWTSDELAELLGKDRPPPPAPTDPASLPLNGYEFAGQEKPFRFGAYQGPVSEEVYTEWKRQHDAAQAKDAGISLEAFLRFLLGMREATDGRGGRKAKRRAAPAGRRGG